MWKDGRAVVGEISYYYVAWIVAECPGHWTLRGDPAAGALTWVDGPMRPEIAITQDFIERVLERARGTSTDGARRTPSARESELSRSSDR